MKNLELKVRLDSFDAIKTKLAALGADFQWTRHQIDHYFQVPQGRLKIRQQDDSPSELVSYIRPDQSEPKMSHYSIFPHDNPDLLLETLSLCLPLSLRVAKIRSLYLWKNVRIHLDHVESLGYFLEFEAVQQQESCGDNKSSLAFLINHLGLNRRHFVRSGYHELKLNQKASE